VTNLPKGNPQWTRPEPTGQGSSEEGDAVSGWRELAQALVRNESGFFPRLAAAARDTSGARFVAIARTAPAGHGVSFVAVDGPTGTVAGLTDESFAPIWRASLETRRTVTENLHGAGRHHGGRSPLRRQGIETVVVVPLEGPRGASIGLLLSGFLSGVEPHSGRAALELWAPLAVLALTEEARTHRARVNEQWQAALVDSLDCGVLLIEPSGRLRLASPRLAPLLGLDPALKAGISTFDDLLHAVRGNLRNPGTAEARWREIHRRGDQAAWDEVELARPSPRILERFARPVEDAEGARLGWMEIYRDVTGEREKRSRLAQIEKMAALGQLISGIAHELNNPLTSIVGFAQLLLDSASRAHDAVAPGLEGREAGLILAEAQRAGAIVRNLLLFAREEAPQRQPVELNEIIERTFSLRQYELRLENIQVIRRLEAALPLVNADPQALQQMVLNLLLNADQALAAQRPSTAGRIEIRTRSIPGPRVQMEISDDGPGIPPEILARVFDAFFTTKPAGEGTGLGLSIVNAIVQSHGGEVRVESEAGQGARFIVELPASEAAAAVPPARPETLQVSSAARRASAASRASRRILVVEDEPVVAQLVAEVLREEGHSVAAILDSFEAFERMTREDFDLLICDLKMPRLDGRSLYEDALRRGRIGPDRVLFITGDTLRPRTLEFLERSGLPFLAKPFMVEELTQAVHSVLERQDSALAAQEAVRVRAALPPRGTA
jgi:signal transduction histidine kinase/FixJ family two-component response regulator